VPRVRPTLLVALLTLLAIAVTPSRARAGEGLARVKRAGVLRWGGDLQGGEPYVYEDPRQPGRLIGFEVDIAAALARAIGVRAEFVENDWSTLVPSLERGTFDVALNGLEVTPSRVARVRFTRPYYVFAERLMARKSDARFPESLKDGALALEALRGKRVGTLANSYAFDLLRDRTNPVIYEGVQEPYADLAEGRVDAVLLDDIIAARYGQPMEALRVVSDVKEGYYAIGVAPADDDLRDALDGALARVTQSGELETILTRTGLWSDRERRLVTWSPADQDAMLGVVPDAKSEAAARTLSLEHVWLFVKASGMTLLVSTLAMALAVPLGIALALARRYGPRSIAAAAGAYVEIYRGTPVLLQLYVLYFGLASIVRMSALTAAIVGLGMNYAAYEAEVYRAGIQAVPPGQLEAALSLGMRMPLALRRVILPQAFRNALPNVTNDFIALLKDSSLVSIITVVELTKQMAITAVDVRGWLLPGALCATLYFAMSYPMSIVARRLERRLARA
jgi:polar amino acid transport system substrate-binding protein